MIHTAGRQRACISTIAGRYPCAIDLLVLPGVTRAVQPVHAVHRPLACTGGAGSQADKGTLRQLQLHA